MGHPKNRTLLLASVIATLCSLSAISKPAEAASLYKGWNYAIDSFNDSITGNNVGGTKYEIYGLALKQTEDKVFIAINANLPFGGTYSQYAVDEHVGWGDLIFNFSGKNLSTASANKNLLGIRFASKNDSGVAATGVYEDVTAKSVATANGMRLQNLGKYNEWVKDRGKTPSIGDLAATDPYFNQTNHVQNVIASGKKIGNINLLSAGNLSSLGLDFGHFGANGSQTIGLSADRSLFPDGNFILHLAPDCDNDIIALKGKLDIVPPESATVPEPSAVLGLTAMGLLFGSSQLGRNKQQKAMNSSAS